MMYWREILKGNYKYKSSIRKQQRVCNMRMDSADTELEREYWRGMRDAYADSANRAHDLIDCYEVR